jgi:hypothetical protein
MHKFPVVRVHEALRGWAQGHNPRSYGRQFQKERLVPIAWRWSIQSPEEAIVVVNPEADLNVGLSKVISLTRVLENLETNDVKNPKVQNPKASYGISVGSQPEVILE